MNIHAVYGTIGRRFRARRLILLRETFDVSPSTRVLDVGGTPAIWDSVPVRPLLTFLNTYETPPMGMRPADTYVCGDGRVMPFADRQFDLVFSNSVIEHLGTWANQLQMAREIARVGQRFFVQTPDKLFPVEPHLLTPFFHYLPRSLQRRLLRFTVWGLITAPTPERCDELWAEVRLLGIEEMRALFPGAAIHTEWFAGLPKSLIALRHRAP